MALSSIAGSMVELTRAGEGSIGAGAVALAANGGAGERAPAVGIEVHGVAKATVILHEARRDPGVAAATE
jgi:hypothetical protein